jgi:hypothetical protein
VDGVLELAAEMQFLDADVVESDAGAEAFQRSSAGIAVFGRSSGPSVSSVAAGDGCATVPLRSGHAGFSFSSSPPRFGERGWGEGLRTPR